MLVGVVAGLAALMLAGIVLFWPTSKGTVRIEINDPNIKVVFDKNGSTVSGVDKQDIKLTPGEQGLHIQRGDLEFDTDKFILKKGETITLKIEWFPESKLQVVQGDKVIGAKTVPPPPPPPGDKWVDLFNGKDLSGWTALGKNGWSVIDGVLTTDGDGIGYLLTDKDYGNFELQLDYRLQKGTNSGVFLRTIPDAEQNWSQQLEIQLLDDDNPTHIGGPLKPIQATGSIYRVTAPFKSANAPAEMWHRLHVRAESRRIVVAIKDTVINEVKLDDHKDKFGPSPSLVRAKGRIALQMYQSKVEFRHIRLRELKP